jgi:uncharacterized membrane protein YdjX (TVP38/TMEM64 family)
VTISRTARRVILGILIVAVVVAGVLLWRSGMVTPGAIKDWLDSLGPAAPLLFLAVFVGTAFLGLPGMAFVVGGRLAFGPYVGFAVGYVGGLAAVTAPFLIARRLRGAGRDPWKPKWAWVAKAMAMVETHPFRAVVGMRLVLWFNAPLSYALAFAPVPARTYVAACAIALAPVVAAAMIATGWFV